jgi:RNA polymerase sigma-70 factor (ECF subfamily)
MTAMGDDANPEEVLLALYERALPVVYGYLVDRCGNRTTAEDLTAETFLAAVLALRGSSPTVASVPWLVGVARHKLVDHWRRQARDERLVQAIGDTVQSSEDPWGTRVDALAAREVLGRLTGDHRAALTLRYVDALPVSEVAEILGRSLEAAEALLVRAKAAYRRASREGGTDA